MASDDFSDNNVVNNRMNLYRTIFGIPSRKRIILGAACVFLVLTLIVITFALMGKQENSKSASLRYALFHSNVDDSVDPCVDFYNFTCGLFAENNIIKENSHRVTYFTILEDDIKEKRKTIFQNTIPSNDLPHVVNTAINFYNKCVGLNNNTADSELLRQYFDQIGGWPILETPEWNESSFDLIYSSAFLIKKLDIHSIIGVYSTDSDKNGGKNVIYLRSPALSDDDLLMNDKYLLEQMMFATLWALNMPRDADHLWDDIVSLQLTVAKWQELLILPSSETEKIFMSINELSTLIPEFDWLKYLQLVTNDTFLEINETLTVHDVIAFDNLDYLKKVVSVINSDVFSKRELANLFGWFIVKNVVMLIPGAMQEYISMSNYNSDEMKSTFSEKCYDMVLELFRCGMDYIYVKNLSHAGIQDNKVLVSYLKLALEDVIQRSHWLDETSKSAILHRVSNMKSLIGFPNYLNNKTEFDELYKDFPKMHEYILTYYFQVIQYSVKMEHLQFKIADNQTNLKLPRTITDVSAYFLVNQNTLVYPISLHNPPFYYFEGPWYLNFGAVGSVIGHEMMHGIDCTGSQGKDLNVPWFSEEARVLYKKRASCFIKQYSVYDSSGTFKNNGTRTLRENIVDTVGLRLSFEAYKKHQKSVKPSQKYKTLDNYTPDQMFFISFGTIWCAEIKPYYKEYASVSHSLPYVRVNKAVSNSEYFAQTFNCPKGSPMNPTDKCRIW